jgi:hypothetical protein
MELKPKSRHIPGDLSSIGVFEEAGQNSKSGKRSLESSIGNDPSSVYGMNEKVKKKVHFPSVEAKVTGKDWGDDPYKLKASVEEKQTMHP